jgi:hypothetical protein
MAERAVPMPIQVRDAFFVELQKIGVDDETKWHTQPKTIALHNGWSVSDMVAAPKPALFLRLGDLSPDPITNNLHRDTVGLIVYCAAEDVHDPEEALWLLMSDVQRAFRENYTMSPAIMVNDPACEPHMEEVSGKAGMGFGLVRSQVYYQSEDIDT